VNAGTLVKAGGSRTTAITGFTFQNTGLVEVDSATLRFGDLPVNGSGILLGQPGTTLQVDGNLTGTTQNAAQFAPQGTVLFNGFRPSNTPQLLEVMSQDLGNTPSGQFHNFAYATLAVGTNTLPTAVRLVDNAHNSAGTGPEALYVNTLVVTAGS